VWASPADQHAAAGGAADTGAAAGAVAVFRGVLQAELFWMAVVCVGGDGSGVELSMGLSRESDGDGCRPAREHANGAAIHGDSEGAGIGKSGGVWMFWAGIWIGGENAAAALAARISGGIGAGWADAGGGDGGSKDSAVGFEHEAGAVYARLCDGGADWRVNDRDRCVDCLADLDDAGEVVFAGADRDGAAGVAEVIVKRRG